MVTDGPDDWKRVGDAVKARRLELGLKQREAALRGRVSDTTWNSVENARRSSFDAATRAGVCRALRWSVDSIDRLLEGARPVEVPADVPDGVSYRATGPRVDAIRSRLHDLVDELADAVERSR